MERIECLLRLTLTPGLGTVSIHRLLSHFGDAISILAHADEKSIEDALKRRKGSREAARVARLIARARDINPRAELEQAQDADVELIPYDSPDYPGALNILPYPPIILYIKGNFPITQDRSVAIVGTRECTEYGIRETRRFATKLAESGCLIISGLARGVDAVAHWSALKAGGQTNAVMPCGLPYVYPPEHRDLVKEIVKTGCLISEYGMHNSAPSRRKFPERNRLIAALGQVVLVTEAPRRSGALITADYADACDRPVFAVPARVDDVMSGGCLALIAEGAFSASSPEDVLNFLTSHVAETVERRPAARSSDGSPEDGAGAEELPERMVWWKDYTPDEEELAKARERKKQMYATPMEEEEDEYMEDYADEGVDMAEESVEERDRLMDSRVEGGDGSVESVEEGAVLVYPRVVQLSDWVDPVDDGEGEVDESLKELSVEGRKILSCLSTEYCVPIEAVCIRTRLPIECVVAELLQLEVLSMVESLPGRFYVLRKG